MLLPLPVRLLPMRPLLQAMQLLLLVPLSVKLLPTLLLPLAMPPLLQAKLPRKLAKLRRKPSLPRSDR